MGVRNKVCQWVLDVCFTTLLCTLDQEPHVCLRTRERCYYTRPAKPWQSTVPPNTSSDHKVIAMPAGHENLNSIVCLSEYPTAKVLLHTHCQTMAINGVSEHQLRPHNDLRMCSQVPGGGVRMQGQDSPNEAETHKSSSFMSASGTGTATAPSLRYFAFWTIFFKSPMLNFSFCEVACA